MLLSIEDGAWSRVSAIIGVCSNNFCAFLADNRRVSYVKDGIRFEDDDTQKIFRLNDSILYGMTGVYAADETISDAIQAIKNVKHATIDDIRDTVLDYLKERKYSIPPSRNYLIGGKMPNSSFRIYEIHMNFETFSPEVSVRAPLASALTSGKVTFGISCLLPEKARERKDYFLGRVEQAITSSTTLNEMLRKAAGVIGDIAKIDDSVGSNVTSLYVS